MLIEEVQRILEENSFEFARCYGCFDIIARRENIFLLKLLTNVDSFQEEQANNLKVVSSYLTAYNFLIGERTRREKLKDDIIYERFDIPTITVKTFEHIVLNQIPEVFRSRGGLFVHIDPKALKRARKEKKLTQAQLAQKIGVSKKSIYEHEKFCIKARYDVANRLKRVLEKDITVAAKLETPIVDKNINEANNPFESRVSNDLKKLGFEIGFVQKTFFNLMAQNNTLIVTHVEERSKRIKKHEPFLASFSSVSKKPVLGITKEEISTDIPSIEEKKLKKLESSKDLIKYVKSW
jgi:putative transcriptional regulator